MDSTNTNTKCTFISDKAKMCERKHLKYSEYCSYHRKRVEKLYAEYLNTLFRYK